MSTRAASDWNIKIQKHRATLLDRLLLAVVLGGLVGLALAYIGLPASMSVQERLAETAIFIASWLVVVIVWGWRSLEHSVRALILIVLAYFVSVFVFYRGGLPGGGRVMLLLLPALGFILVGPRLGILAGILGVLTYASFALAINQNWLVHQMYEDMDALGYWVSEGASFLLVVAILTTILWSFNRGWLEALAETSAANEQLQARTQELEETTEWLRRHTSQLQATAEIARAGSSILDPEILLTEVVNRIQEGFSPLGVYYVGLFLLDEEQPLAVLRAATGEAGRLLLEMGYKLELAETSTIGWCITHQQARVALDIEETIQLDALSMPNTRSEIALPLRSRDRILGALSVQSSQEAAFKETDIAILQTMADQVAAAIDNARLFSQTETALREVQAAHRRYLVREWKEFLDTRPVTRIDYPQAVVEPEDAEQLRQARRKAMTSGQTVIVDGLTTGAEERGERGGNGETATSHTALVVPLKLRGQAIGTIALHEMRRQRPWTAEEIALAETVAEQVALTVETLRLMDVTQRRSAREQLVGEIAGRVRASLDPDTILKTTVRELGRALGAESASIEMTAPAGHRPVASAEPPFGGDVGADAPTGGDGGTPGEEPARSVLSQSKGEEEE